MEKAKASTMVVLAASICAGAYCANKDISVGGAISVTLEDVDAAVAPGPVLGSERSGNIAELSIGMANDYVMAGLKLSLALGLDNVKYNDDPVTYFDKEGYTPFPLKSAYIRMRRVLGVADLQFDVDGNLIGVGSKVASNSSRQFDEAANAVDPRTGLSIDIPGILEYFTVKIMANQDPGGAATPTTAAVDDVWAGKATLLFEGDLLSLGASAGAFDIAKYDETWFAGAEAQVSFGERYRASLFAEGTMIGTYYGAGGAAWGGLQIDAFGFNLSGNLYAKTERFGSDTTVLAISSAKNEFDSRKDTDCLAVDGSLSYNPRSLLGSDLITVKAGASSILTGIERWGWSAGATVSLSQAASLPLMLGGEVWKYGDSGLGLFGNEATLWKAYAIYDYHGLTLKAELGQREYDDPMTEGTKRDAAFGYTMSASVAF